MTAQSRARAGLRNVLSRPGRRPVLILATIAMLVSIAAAAIGLSLAIFMAQGQGQAIFGSKAVFPGERSTPAFQVGDASAGSEVDRSSSFAFVADGRTSTSSAWSTAFAADRYLEFDLNASLGSGVPVAVASFDLRLASTGTGTACYYFEVRRISTGAVIATHGSQGGPVGCVTGTTLTSFSTAIPAVATTSIANDLRIRVFGNESAGAAMTIDVATVSGTTAYQAFTLYPVLFRDAADTTVSIVPWGLDLP